MGDTLWVAMDRTHHALHPACGRSDAGLTAVSRPHPSSSQGQRRPIAVFTDSGSRGTEVPGVGPASDTGRSTFHHHMFHVKRQASECEPAARPQPSGSDQRCHSEQRALRR